MNSTTYKEASSGVEEGDLDHEMENSIVPEDPAPAPIQNTQALRKKNSANQINKSQVQNNIQQQNTNVTKIVTKSKKSRNWESTTVESSNDRQRRKKKVENNVISSICKSL